MLCIIYLEVKQHLKIGIERMNYGVNTGLNTDIVMADNLSPDVRRKNMANIRAQNTKPEVMVGKYLFSRGLRYRKNVKSLPGKPDFVFKKYKTFVFVNGCFWHRHDCGRFHWPKSNIEYWKPKIMRNIQRDNENYQALEAMGWHVLIIWECELKKDQREKNLNRLYNDIVQMNNCTETAISTDEK